MPLSDLSRHNLRIGTPVEHDSFEFEAPYACLLHEKLTGEQIVKRGFYIAQAAQAYGGGAFSVEQVTLIPYSDMMIDGIEKPYALELGDVILQLQQILEQNGIIKKLEPAKALPKIIEGK